MDDNSFLQGAAFVIEAVCEELEVSQSRCSGGNFDPVVIIIFLLALGIVELLCWG